MVNKIEKIDSIETYNDLKGMANLLNSFSESDSDNNLVDKKDKPVKKDEPVKVKKKRGRKPKNKKETESEIKDKPVKVKKKRGRKPKAKPLVPVVKVLKKER